MDLYGLSDRALLEELGRRLKRRRLDRNQSQEELALSAGLDRATIGKLERGGSVGTLILVQILRALGALEDLDAMLPDPGLSPLQLAKFAGRERQRASRRHSEKG
jgi:transcriptional regulator with XRE-family HTH domain